MEMPSGATGRLARQVPSISTTQSSALLAITAEGDLPDSYFEPHEVERSPEIEALL
jgi:hypothetical protein